MLQKLTRITQDYHIPLDGHPTPTAHRALAEYVLRALRGGNRVHASTAAR